MSVTEGAALSFFYNIAFHEVSVAESPLQLDKLLDTAILMLRGEERTRKMTLWNMSRVLTSLLGGGRGSLPPDLGRVGKGEKINFKTVFKKRSV